MLVKQSYFASENEAGFTAIPLFTSADKYFEKTASAHLMPEVVKYIEGLRPMEASQYVLVNAMGAGENYGSNINGDYFGEAGLIHKPDDWSGNPVLDRIKAKTWWYGFPTFYLAHACAHHKNKDSSKAYGEVELAAWSPFMKRVELVVRVDHDKCVRFGGTGVWDKLKSGGYADVSMGSKVPFDTCFPAGTLVRTYFGYRPIEEVQVGDLVLTHTGDPMLAVTATMSREVDELVRVSTRGLPDTDTTANHPYLVLRKEMVRACRGIVNGQGVRHSPDSDGFCSRCGQSPLLKPDWVAAEDIRPGDYLAMPIKRAGEVLEVSLDLARLLGIYLGDGHIIRQRTGKAKRGEYKDMGVSVTVGDAYQEHLESLIELIGRISSGEPRTYDAGEGRNASIVNVYDQELARWVQDFGGRTSAGKRLREEVFQWQDEAKLHLVGGLIDADGSYDAKSGATRILSSNRGLVLDVHRLLLQLRIPASVGFAGEGGGYGPDCKMWQVFIPASSSNRLSKYALKVQPKESRLGSQVFFSGDYWFAPVTGVETLQQPTTVFNLSVEHDESYVVEGRAVHNCSVCTDWKLYNEALATFDPAKFSHPGQAVLQFHRDLKEKGGKGIRGLSITRNDYCEHAAKAMNRILPDGRKIFVHNDFPRFFDISFVFIGADRTAKVMLFIFSGGKQVQVRPSADVAALEQSKVEDGEKTASVEDVILFSAFGKSAEQKVGEIEKQVPSNLAAKAVPLLTKKEPDLPEDVLRVLGKTPLESGLSTLGSLGIVLRPSEFQKVVLLQLGQDALADSMSRKGQVFPEVEESEALDLSPKGFLPALLPLLLPLLSMRSGLGPIVEQRVIILSGSPEKERGSGTSLSTELMRKIGAAYNGYRSSLMDLVAHSQNILGASNLANRELSKIASAPVESIFTPLAVTYLHSAFRDEVGGAFKQAFAGVERGASPQRLRETN